MVEKVSIEIRKDLYDLIKEEVERSEGEFKSVEEYIEFVLEELLSEEEEEEVYTEEEEEEIKRRLRALGYIS
ncbi:CopG family transcriptional regulator [Candidatus Bathyarchaeota archaeon]|nr:MAG: CopG family transcriptional regulator [Candidatus Bathyarchaeota archaeon]